MWAELVKQLVIGAIIVYVLFGMFLFFAQKSLIYLPDNTPHNECTVFSEQIVHNSTRMYVAKGNDKALVVYHGNAGRACDRVYMTEFTERTVVVVEYEGYAGQGRPSSAAHHQNVQDVHEWLSLQQFTDVAVLGESLGSGLAAYHTTLGGVDRVVLVAPYRRLSEVAQYHYRIYPARLLLREQYEVQDRLAEFTGPVLTLHGEHDSVIPVHLSEGLPGRVVVQTGHNDLYSHVRDKLTEFLD